MTIPARYIVDLFTRTNPIDIVAGINAIHEDLTAKDRSEALHSLALANEHRLIAQIFKNPAITPEIKKRGFLGAIAYGSRESFDLLLPEVTPVEVDGAFKAVAGNDQRWQPRIESRAFLSALISAGSKDPDMLAQGAIRLAQDHRTEPADRPSAALMVLDHEAFPKDRLNEVLIAIGLGENRAVIEALIAKSGVSLAIHDLYQAVQTRDEARLARALSQFDVEHRAALQRAALHCITNEFPSGAHQIIEKDSANLNFQELASYALYRKDENTLRLLVEKGLTIAAEHISHVVYENDVGLLHILLTANGVPEAIKSYLINSEANNPSKEWLSKREKILARLKALVAPQ